MQTITFNNYLHTKTISIKLLTIKGLYLNHSLRIKTIAAATLLACCQIQSAHAALPFAQGNFSFLFSNGGATATGTLTSTAGIGGTPTSGNFGGSIPFSSLSALNVVVAGAASGNGTFTLVDFNSIAFSQNLGTLDFTQNLVGQAALTDFNLFGTVAPAPRGTNFFLLTSDYGSGTSMTLTCLALQGFAPACGAAAPISVNPNAAYMASTQTVNGALDSVQTRLDSVRDGGISDDLNTSMTDDLQQGKVMLASNGDATGLFDAADAKKYSFWVKAFGAHGNQDQKNSFSGYTDNTYGTAFGADTLLANNWLVGAAFTYAHTGVDLHDARSGDDTNIKTYQLTAYTSHNFGTWYVDGMAAYAKHDYNGSRNTGLAVAKADFSGDQYAARVNVGMPIAYNDVTVTPMAGLEYNHLSQDGYTETGAGALSLNVQGESKDRVRSMLGTKVGVQKDIGNGITMSPSIHVAWRHDFNRSGMDLTSTLTGGGAAFTTPGQKLAQDSFNAGAGLAFQKSKNFTFSVIVDGEEAAGYKSVSG
jgi:outer membrane autotransporter protein